MTSYEFSLRLNREVADDELDALYEAGCGDAGVETGPLGAVADFDREAPSLAQAIASAVRDIEKVPGLRAVGVRCDNMVNLLGIAQRAGVSREAARLWATGKRGPGGFPKPSLISAGGEQLWDWLEVSSWLEQYREHGQRDATPAHRVHELREMQGKLHEAQRHDILTSQRLDTLRIFRTADRVLAARDALMSEPDDDVREEFERLLEDA
ncbi:MAG TPA: hypothetical protein VIZ43_22900 [Trebonia sp.]